MIWKLEERFKSRFKVAGDARVLIMTGSGALALEACAYSSNMVYDVLGEGKFADQLRGYFLSHLKFRVWSAYKAYVHYETSTSTLNKFEDQSDAIVDCVSSFPYYDPPKADVWVTVSGKQLHGSPGIALVVVRERAWGTILEAVERASYLSLARYRNQLIKWETPNTPALTVMRTLYNALVWTDFEWQKTTALRRWEILKSEFGAGVDQAPPVYTFNGLVSLDGVELYGKSRTQLFLYNHPHDADGFDLLVDKLRRLRRETPGSSQWWY